MNDIMQLYNAFMNSPVNMLKNRFSIPQEVDVNNPNAIIQYLLNTRQVSQEQINQVMQMRNTPMVQMLMGGKR